MNKVLKDKSNEEKKILEKWGNHLAVINFENLRKI